MVNLVVRNIDDKVVKAPKARAASAEAEYHKILNATLLRSKKRRLLDVLKAIPSVGKDSDFTS